MAKYSRYDLRNKNKSRHKKQSLNKDIRIRKVDEDRSKYNLRAFADIAFANDDLDEEYFSEKYD